MKKKLFILAVAVMTLLVSIQPSMAADLEVVYQPKDSTITMMSCSRAHKKIESMKKLTVMYRVDDRNTTRKTGGYTYGGTHLINSIKIGSDKVAWDDYWRPSIEFDSNNYIHNFCTSYFKSMNVSVRKGGSGIFYVFLGNIEVEAKGTPTLGESRYYRNDIDFGTMNKDDAVSLANAFYVLKRCAEGYTPAAPGDDLAAEAAFAKKAERYREMPVKPALPEDVQRYRVMAEDAFNNKNFEKALEYYSKGLAIEPLWPQGQFNAAMLAGELRWYDWAALYMKHYLELVPDAKNANIGREKMYLWEGKAEEEMQQKLTVEGK